MNTVIFNSGQEVEARDLMTSQLYLQNEIKDRSLDFLSPGLVGTEKQYVFQDTNNTLRFEPFRAININGEVMQLVKSVGKLALRLGSGDWRLTTQGTLSTEEWGFTPGIVYRICARYITKYTRPRAHVVSQQGRATRLSSGVELWAIPESESLIIDGINPFVMLGLYTPNADSTRSTLVIDNVAEYARIYPEKMVAGGPNATVTSIYNPRNLAVSFAEHIMALGSAVPTPDNPHGMDLTSTNNNLIRHETYLHDAGFIGDISSVSSLGYMLPNVVSENTSTTPQDNLIIYNLNANNLTLDPSINAIEYMTGNGNWLTSFAFSGQKGYIHFLDYVTGGSTVYAADGWYKFGANYETGEIVAVYEGSLTQELTALVITASSSVNSDHIGEIKLTTAANYNSGPILDLCRIEFKKTDSTGIKPLSYISGTTRSNFIQKEDLRLIGSISPKRLQATKVGDDSIIKFPGIIEVSKIKFTNTDNILAGYTGLPTGYINGFSVSVSGGAEPIVTVTPGTCKDVSDTVDIYLRTTIGKKILATWESGGDANNPVGGLSPNILSLPTSNTTFHVFVVATASGSVDIAIDTQESGANILASNIMLADVLYIRRIASIYAIYSDNTFTIHTATSYLEGPTLCMIYGSPLVLTATATTNTIDTLIPRSKTTKFTANLTYRYADINYANSIYTVSKYTTDTVPQLYHALYISGAGTLDLPLNTGEIHITLPDGVTQAPYFYLLGYKDTRNG